MTDPDTTELLRRWGAGDHRALDELLKAHVGWLQSAVRRRLGAGLRTKLESGDIVQNAVIDLLRDGPKLRFASGEDFRRFMLRVVVNAIRDASKWFSAKRRDLGREVLLEGAAAPADSQRTPFGIAANRDDLDQVRTVLEVLSPEDQRVLLLREWDGKSFREIAAELSLSSDAVRMRHARAMKRFREGLSGLRSDDLDRMLAATDA